MPRLWGVSHPSGIREADQNCDRSSNAQLSMKPYKISSKKTTEDRKYGFRDITTIANESEEAIMTPNHK
jgi:hypothetical protein